MPSVRRTGWDSPVRKNQKLESLDRISNLPNDIKHLILSYLPIKEAGRTSILSRNWRFQWTMLPSLVVSDSCNLDKLLLLHHAPIDSFKLSGNHRRGAIHRCILHLSRNPITKFILNFVRRRHSYCVPSYLFSCQDLTHLELSYCKLRLPAWTSQGFRNLKTLVIQKTILIPQELAKIIASSPLLESLTLCHMKVPMSGFKIDAPNLRFLKLLGDFEDVELTSTLNLVHLSTDDRNRGMWDIILRSTHALQELEISSVPQETEEASYWEFSKLQRLKVTNFDGAKSDVEFIKHLLVRSPALQELEVSVHELCRQVKYSWLSHYDQNGTYSTTQLRLVKVTGICGAQVEEFFKFLLLSCKALEELHILFEENEYEYVNEYENQNCVFTQLRVMKIGGFSGAKAEVGLIRFLLTSSPMLQQITLQPASANVSWEVSKLLNEFKGNLVQANIELLDPLNPSDDYYHSRASRSRSPDYRRRSRSADYRRRSRSAYYRRRSRSPSMDYDSDLYY